jgi:hypothetical protein
MICFPLHAFGDIIIFRKQNKIIVINDYIERKFIYNYDQISLMNGNNQIKWIDLISINYYKKPDACVLDKPVFCINDRNMQSLVNFFLSSNKRTYRK